MIIPYLSGMRTSFCQRGFAIGTILLAVVLIAVIVSAVAVSSRGNKMEAKGEKAGLHVSTVMGQMLGLEQLIERMTIKGIDIRNIVTRVPPSNCAIPGYAGPMLGRYAALCPAGMGTRCDPAADFNCVGGNLPQPPSDIMAEEFEGRGFYTTWNLTPSATVPFSRSFISLAGINRSACLEFNRKVNDPTASTIRHSSLIVSSVLWGRGLVLPPNSNNFSILQLEEYQKLYPKAGCIAIQEDDGSNDNTFMFYYFLN